MLANHRIFIVFLALLGASALVGSATGAERSPTDEAVARLESHADSLRRQILLPPKEGQVVHAKLRAQLRSIGQEVARLESGGSVDESRLAALTGSRRAANLRDRQVLANRVERRQEALERRLRPAGPKLGSLGRQAVRQDLDQIDEVIAALESGEELDPNVLDDVLGTMIAAAYERPEDRIREGEVRLAALKRKLRTGPKLGSLGRERVRKEIEALDALIDRLEAEIDQEAR